MNLEIIREYCLAKKAVEEGLPFGEDVLVFKVMGKIFLLTSLDNPISINLKCEPDYAIELREKYEEVIPGFHMNKKMWNTVSINGSLHQKFILDLIDHSYNQVVLGFSKKMKEELNSI